MLCMLHFTLGGTVLGACHPTMHSKDTGAMARSLSPPHRCWISLTICCTDPLSTILKIEWVTEIFVSQVWRKLNSFKFWISKYCSGLRFWPKILPVIFLYMCVQSLYSKIGQQTTPSLMFKGFLRPPLSTKMKEHFTSHFISLRVTLE